MEVVVYPRLMHVVKGVNSKAFHLPGKVRAAKRRFKDLEKLATDLQRVDDRDLTGYRVEVVTWGINLTLDRAVQEAERYLPHQA